MKPPRGMAVILALLLVALSASAAALVLWQQGLWWHQLQQDQRRARLRAWLQSEVSWAISRLPGSPVVAYGQPWAEPLSGQEQTVRIQARLLDMQGRLNLNALSQGPGLLDTAQLEHFRRLLQALQLPQALADELVRWRGLQSQEARARQGMTARLRRPVHWHALLQVPGYTPQVLARLEPYATLLADDVRTVNLNTAPRLLLQAMLPQAAAGSLESALAERERRAFRHPGELLLRLNLPSANQQHFGVGSSYFLLQGSVRDDVTERRQQALLQVAPGRVQLLWRREETPAPDAEPLLAEPGDARERE